MDSANDITHKSHRERKSGRKAGKKLIKKKKSTEQILDERQRNPKAFGCQSAVKAQRQNARSQDITQKKLHIPVIDRTPLQPPPVVVAVVGGPAVGKSTLLRCLIKNYTRQKLSTIAGPVTIVTGKKHRFTFIEVVSEIQCMIDVAKVADVVLMLIDITKGIEMEIMEFFEICRSHGSPRIMGILNHLDVMDDNKAMRRRKKELKHRFQVELYPGAKLFYLSGFKFDEYLKNEVSNLGRFVSVQKFRPLQYRSTHPYAIVDRIEDITNAETIRTNPLSDRKVVLYGYVRGIPMKENQPVHIPGVGDFRLKEISILDDPCPLPDRLKKRSLNSKERILYAPMSGVSGVMYDEDAVYIELKGSHHMRKKAGEDEGILEPLLNLQKTIDEKQAESQFKLFSHSKPIDDVNDGDGTKFESEIGEDGRLHRKVIFDDKINYDSDDENEDDDDGNLGGDFTDESSDDEENEPPQKKPKQNGEYDPMSLMRENMKKNKEESLMSKKKEEALKKKEEALKKKEESLKKKEESLKKKEEETMESEDIGSRLEKTALITPGVDLSLSGQDYVSYFRNSIYGDTVKDSDSDCDSDDEETAGGLFSTRSQKRQKQPNVNLYQDRFHEESSGRKKTFNFEKWTDEFNLLSIRDCFVTGEWGEKEDAEKLLKMDAEDDLYGDFEDLESGVAVTEENQEDGETTIKKISKEEKTVQEKRQEKKKRLKEYFDSQYDNKGNDHFETIKEEMVLQSQLNRTQFEDLDDETRVQYEGYRAGLYVRMVIEGMYCEFITNFESKYPVIVGGLLDSELTKGFIKTKLKVHRWFPRILKNRDPLTMSIGWRRFQTVMYYAKREDNFRYRSLKYARKFLHVEAFFWGPIADPSTGFVALQNIKGRNKEFSIAATGVVQDTDQSTKIVKKLKLIGYPKNIFEKTAFIKDMFHSETEVAKFGGVRVQTQSMIRGILKKPDGPNGDFRATFEDKIKMSDTVILKTWASIEVVKFCSYIKNYLLGDKSQWQGLKTNAEVKKDLNIRNNPDLDSMYSKITERREHIPLPLKIPKALQKALPFKDKPKNNPKFKKQQRVLVVKDPEEVKMDEFMSRLKVIVKDNIRTKNIAKKIKHKKYKKIIEEREVMKNMRMRKSKAMGCKLKSQKSKK